MSFWGNSFSFHDIPCEDYELMMYSIDGISHSDGKFASITIIEEDRPSYWKPHFYGTKYEEKLSFSIIFGVDERRIESHDYLTREELADIADWLMGHRAYQWLEIHQEDLEFVRYKCIVTNLEIIEYDTVPWAIKATFVCDGPFAYLYPQTYEYYVSGEMHVDLFNESTYNGLYYPKLDFYFDNNSNSLDIINESDNNSVCSFSRLPQTVTHISIDNENRVITTDDNTVNPYQYTNYGFLGLVRGNNSLVINGHGILRITCEFPINIGG